MSLDQTRLVQAWGTPTMGCDPEIFFTTQEGKVVGAEKVIGDKGLYDPNTRALQNGHQVVLDGVQAELHPHPSTFS